MKTPEQRAEEIAQQYAIGEGVLRCEEAIAAAIREAVKEERDRIAQFIEDDRYNLPGREAEWSRFIARKIRGEGGGE